ncbi:MAG TPA: hypothetical protein DCL35_03680 [Candidatus Omnitrophica bacterium]|nr:hypothetical protein [Candidatus Omnitrophota bacterium]
MNYKLSRKIILIIFAAFFCAGNVSAESFNKKEEDTFYVAVKAYEDGFYDASLTLFDRYLKTYIDTNKKIDALIYIGQCYFFQEKYVKALDQFESLLKMEGTDRLKDKILFWLGEVYLKGRDYRQAAEFYNKLIKDHSDSFYVLPAKRSLASAFFNESKYEQALEIYRSIIAGFDEPSAVEEAYSGICEILYRLKDYAKLRTELADLIVKFPQSRMINRAYFYLGEANFYLNDFQEAIDAYQKADVVAESQQQSDLSNIGLGWTYLKLKKYDEAKEAFSKFAEQGVPASVLLGKAVLESALSSYDKALELFDKVIADDRTGEYSTFAHFGRAEVLYNLSHFNEAIIAYRVSLDKLKMATGLYADTKELRDKIFYGLAWAYLKVGDFTSAQEVFQKIASLSNDKIVKLSAMVQSADTYQDAGEYKKAIEAYQHFLIEYPDTVYNDYIQYQLGMTWLKMDNMESAVLAFRKLLESYPSSQLIDDSHYFLGMAYFRRGDFSASRKQLSEFLTSLKSSSYRLQALFFLGESLVNLAEFKPAIDIFNIVIKEGQGQESLRQKAEYEIANAFASMGNEAEAHKRLSDFIARYPESQLSPDILFWLGQSYSAKKNFALSRKYFERLVRNYPDHELIGDCLLEIGLTYLEDGDEGAALRIFSQAKEAGRGSSLSRAWILSGDIYSLRSDLKNALENYNEALRLGSGLARTAGIKMAALYKRQRMFKEAIAALEQAQAVDGPESGGQIQFNIAELFDEMGAAQEAMDGYLKVSYLYPHDDRLVVKSLLRLARIYENKENRPELIAILEKILRYDCPEAKYAMEKLSGLREPADPGGR